MLIEISNDIRNKFKHLQSEHNLDGIIEYLSSILSINNVDNLLAGFCYWNISDSFAMQRKAEELYANHLRFCKMLDIMDSKYKFWSVCDATQRFTLELGGYGDFWWDIYKNALDLNPNTTDIERIVFDTHVAAISINLKVENPKSRLYLAKDNFEKFVMNSANSENEAFYKLVYSSHVLKVFGDEACNILNLCNRILPFLKENIPDSEYAVGEWERLNAPRSRQNMAQVGINRAINAFVDVGKKAQAKELYNEALNYGLTRNTYIEKRL